MDLLAGLFIQHPLWESELAAIEQSNLNVVAGHDPEPADDGDFLAKVWVESVIDLCRQRAVSSVYVVSNERPLHALLLPNLA